MRVVLDTGVLIAGDINLPGAQMAVASLTWAELGFGVQKARDPLQRAHREARLARLRHTFGAGLPFDDAAAQAYTTICGLVLGIGRDPRPRAVDLMIAATAKANAAAVMTRNGDYFAGLEGFVQIIAP
jgi:hypothetical protein